MLLKQCPKIGEQLLGRFGQKAVAAKPRDQFLLTDDVPLALGDMIVDHLQIGCSIGHG